MKKTAVRVAIYTRKSVTDGLDQEFNSLDAQRQAIEAYILSQKGEGWMALPEHYDDGGFTGANTQRPAFQRLLQDIEDGKVDAICVYKIDRLSRRLSDFAKIIDFFDKHNVSFTAVTQQFSTSNPTGKLTLNILMSFAEFERQVISERTRDKLAASRKNGMWTGGRVPLGYDAVDKKLVINKAEAKRVQDIYQLYLQLGSLLAVVDELQRRKWLNKTWTTKTGKNIQGQFFSKVSLRQLLTNPVYLGMVTYQGKTYDGVHDDIISKKTWDAVQAMLKDHAPKIAYGRMKWTALLQSLVRCGKCGASYSHHYTNKANRKYRAYVCQTHMQKGAAACPGSRIPAVQLETFVVDKIMAIGKNPALVAETVTAAKRQLQERRPGLQKKMKRLLRDKKKLSTERSHIVDAVGQGKATGVLMQRLVEIDTAYEKAAKKVQDAECELAVLDQKTICEKDLKEALAAFMPVWDQLFLREQGRILHLLIENIVYNAVAGELEITFRPGGVRQLACETGEEAA